MRKLKRITLYFGLVVMLLTVLFSYTTHDKQQSVIKKEMMTTIIINTPHNKQANRQHLPTMSFSVTQEDIMNLRDDVTLVTAYFNLGAFQKGELKHEVHTPVRYRQWMRIFAKINNPVIAYFDTQSDVEHFESIRSNLNRNATVIKSIRRSELWSFSLYDDIGRIYQDPDYPKHHPNTVDANYACAMHAKYELMQMSMQMNPFETRYFAWIDIGIFRDLNADLQPKFHMKLPPNFDESKIAYSDVWRGFKTNITDDLIFKGNFVWICGCFFVGRIDKMAKWTKEYLEFTDYFIKKGLMNSDQQVIFAMFSNHKPVTQLQTYFSDGEYNQWFHLAYECMDIKI